MDLLNTLGQTAASFILVLGVMIFVRELGDHLMAKWLGIRVDTFSLGFGPRLFGFQMGGTDYRVSLLPLGGYVKMAGEHIGEELTGAPDEFLSRPKRHRFLVAIAGPVMNVLLAIVLLAFNYMVGVQEPAYLNDPAVIGAIRADSPAERAGLQFRDRLEAFNGEPVPTWRDQELQIGTSPNQRVTLTVERDGRMIDKQVDVASSGPNEVGTIGILPYSPYIVSDITPGSPAEAAGLRVGDEVLSASYADETAVGFWAILLMVSGHEGDQPVEFKVRRDGQEMNLSIVPRFEEEHKRVMIGASRTIEINLKKYGPIDAVYHATLHNYKITLFIFDILGKLVTGKLSMRQLSGPIGIAQVSAAAAAGGLLSLLGLMSFISLQLGILNLLPIPILDGGVITLLAIEGLIGRDLSLQVKERVMQVGFIFLVILMSVVIFNDLSKLGLF